MILRPIDQYFQQQAEPVKSSLLSLRQMIIAFDTGITEGWKYGMPYYYYHNKLCCYLWIHKKNGLPYIGFVNGNLLSHPLLIQEDRKRMKILLIDPEIDFPVRTISQILQSMISIYR